MVKNCDRGLENAARGRRPRAAFSGTAQQVFELGGGGEGLKKNA